MTASTKSREIRIPIKALRRGLFVSGLDRDWSETPFPFQGFLVEAEHQVEELLKLCAWICIDPAYSDPAALSAIAHQTADDDSARRTPPAREARVSANSITPRGQPVAWLRRGPPPRKPPTKRALKWPPVEALPANERSPLVPQTIPLVHYKDETPFEAEIQAADSAAAVAGESLKDLLDEMAQGGELNLGDLRSSAEELALSVVRNPDALQWLVRMRENHTALYSRGVKVAVYLMSLARHLGFAPAELVQMATIGLLLDVGKIYVDEPLLKRAGPLNAAEHERVRQHVQAGIEALTGGESLHATVLEAIAQHHERVDGTGYPNGLTLDAISIHGRMAAIADSFAAMTSPRPYARTMAPFEAMKTMYAEAGTKFHAPLVEQFVQAVGIFPTGALVELSTGEAVVVVCHNRVRRLEPRVLVVTDAAKKLLDRPYEMDLMTQSQGSIDSKPARIDRGLPDGAYGLDLSALYAG
jgi:HD-GYP domain-containing protein (c-di-GMP phosphodiesterase class II)